MGSAKPDQRLQTCSTSKNPAYLTINQILEVYDKEGQGQDVPTII